MERPAHPGLTLSACAPLFYNAFRQRNAGAVIHSHSVEAVMATLTHREVFRVSHVEMIKGIRGHGYADTVEVPIIPNTAHECDLTDSLSAAIDAWPASDAVLVERHGVYVWGLIGDRPKLKRNVTITYFDTEIASKQLGLSRYLRRSLRNRHVYLAIRTIGDPILRAMCRPVAPKELARPDFQKFIDDLKTR